MLPDMTGSNLSSHLLLDDADARITLLEFPAGHLLPEHKSSYPVSIQVVSGDGDLTLGNETRRLETGTLLHLPAALPHSVRAGNGLRLLLTVQKKAAGSDAPSWGTSPNAMESERHPMDVLLDCHRRCDRFLRVLHLLTGQSGSAKLENYERSSLELALRFFRDERPLHHRDEEDSLFPRLEKSFLGPRLERLRQEHQRLDEIHQALRAAIETWMQKGGLGVYEKRDLEAWLAAAMESYARHRRMEEEEVFSFAKQNLSPEVWEEIAQEFAARRR